MSLTNDCQLVVELIISKITYKQNMCTPSTISFSDDGCN